MSRVACSAEGCNKTFREKGTGLAYHLSWAHGATRKAQPKASKARKAAPKVQMCRVKKAGRACMLTFGHKAKGRRHRFENVSAETLSRTTVADSTNGKIATRSRSRRATKVA